MMGVLVCLCRGISDQSLPLFSHLQDVAVLLAPQMILGF